jgi:hypothetical protein
MGHQRLGNIPKSKKWAAVVDDVVGGSGLAHEDVGSIAALTLEAARPALEKSKNDPGLRYTFYLLTQIVLAARRADWRERLSSAGISISPEASLFDLTAGVQAAVDDHVARHGRPTDISEMAQQAAGEALASLAGASATTLFGSGGEYLQSAIRDLSTKDGFSRLGQVFFGRFLARFLNFYLSRVTASKVGTDRLPSIAQVSQFNEALERHCHQSARIVRDFCGQWYSKTEYIEGIDPANTSRFMAVALRKLGRELAKQRAEG